MLADTVLDALCIAQESIGKQMTSNAVSLENLSAILVTVSHAWGGSDVTTLGQVPGTKTDGGSDPEGYLPDLKNHSFWTTAQIQFMVTYLAGLQGTATGEKLTRLQTDSSAWSKLSSEMSNFESMQKAPIDTTQQGESSQIQQDQSQVSSSSSLGSGLADYSSTAANLLPSIQA